MTASNKMWMITIMTLMLIQMSAGQIDCYVCDGSSMSPDNCSPPYSNTTTLKHPQPDCTACQTNTSYTNHTGIMTYKLRCLNTTSPPNCLTTSTTQSCTDFCSTTLCIAGPKDIIPPPTTATTPSALMTTLSTAPISYYNQLYHLLIVTLSILKVLM